MKSAQKSKLGSVHSQPLACFQPAACRSTLPPRRHARCSTHADKHATSKLAIMGLKGHTAEVTGLSWSPDGTALATACDDRTVRIFNLADPTAKSIPFRKKELRVGVQDVAFADDEQHVAVQVRRRGDVRESTG